MMSRMEIWWRALVDLLLPRVCLVCGRKLGLHEEHNPRALSVSSLLEILETKHGAVLQVAAI